MKKVLVVIIIAVVIALLYKYAEQSPKKTDGSTNTIENDVVMVSFKTNKTALKKGDDFRLIVSVKNSNDMQAYQLALYYDKKCVTPFEFIQGDFLRSKNIDSFFHATTPGDIDGGVVKITEAITNQSSGVTGGGDLFSVDFEVLAACNKTQITIGESVFITPQDKTLNINADNGWVWLDILDTSTNDLGTFTSEDANINK